MRVHEGAQNDAIYYAHKGCAMQMWEITLTSWCPHVSFPSKSELFLIYRVPLTESYFSNRPQVSMVYLKVNAFIARELSGFTWTSSLTMNEKSASCGIETFEFIVSERVQINPVNSRAMSALTLLLFKLNTLQKNS